MVMPTAPVIGRPVHRRNLFEQPGFHGAQTNPVHPIAVQVMHDQHRRGIVVDVIHRLINLGPGEQAVGFQLLSVLPPSGPIAGKNHL